MLPVPEERKPGLIGSALVGGEPTSIAFHYHHGKLFDRKLIESRFQKVGSDGKRRFPPVSLTLTGKVVVPHDMTVKVWHCAGGVSADHGELFVGGRRLGIVGDDTVKSVIYVLKLPKGTHDVRWVLTCGTFQNSMLRFEDPRNGKPLDVYHSADQVRKTRSHEAEETVAVDEDPEAWLKTKGVWQWEALGEAE